MRKVSNKLPYNHFISHFFHRWFSGNEKSRAKLFRVMVELYFIDCLALDRNNNNLILFITDDVLTAWLDQYGRDMSGIGLYEINRFLLHALNIPVNQWSPLFTQLLLNIPLAIESTGKRF